MIKIRKISKKDDLSSINNKNYDLFIYGEDIDERTSFVLNEVKIRPQINIKYNNIKYDLIIDKSSFKLNNAFDYFKNKELKSILIDTTSLDFPDLLYTLDAINKSSKEIEITLIYVEPEQYKKQKSMFEEDEEFILSDNKNSFSALPLFAISNQTNINIKSTLISFLGFENFRLGQVLEADDGANYSRLVALFSVPAYQAGWENKSLKKHTQYFKQLKTQLTLYPGNNPYEVEKVLSKIYKGCEKMVVVSLGTKPSAIGIITFLINNVRNNSLKKQLGAMYDYPIKTKNRSSGIGEIYIYELHSTTE
ncbi:TPA: hypothetical protein ACPZOZ_003840 [Yersinia enterocolitica]|uniref:Uncharacterized protein n=1 Tax=Yersinia enterocolitica TaxID=630 RepID=A0AAD2V2W5_YEREN|nr:hypothetical protein [Yersinia enterocolitica]ELI8103842.1 hypothetical protein [Yersinia enterocolitica]CQR16594.1 Uncharacterised protein [Yersinia enterocolitica]CRX55988.1 Uncharacterised protein [Yersinia enterocolitica]HDZ9656397.1 hypothetical protein [Yersinia enterocolitica]